MLKKKLVKNCDELKEFILSRKKALYISSKTSTVIPYNHLESSLSEEEYLCDLSQISPHMQLQENGDLTIRGNVSWKDMREYLNPKGRQVMTAPTEELALVLAGVATSCTGERCFRYGTLRSQIRSLKYMDFNGQEVSLSNEESFDQQIDTSAYQNDYQDYKDFKNAPFPRLEKACDLMTGTEGQLGIVTEVTLKTCPLTASQFLFILLPKWEEDDKAHLEVIEKIQHYRDRITICELIDSNAFSYLAPEDRPNKNKDAIFFEVEANAYEDFYTDFILNLKHIDQEEVFELTQSKFHMLRASIPRAVFEKNSEMGVKKMGTDVQVRVNQFKELLAIYRGFSKQSIKYNLFGHFGDAHLHFNFMPLPDQIDKCQDHFENMYRKVVKLKGSPFAEHGIGLLKQRYITQFWTQQQVDVFQKLKEKYDPHNQFFPSGFLNKSLR